MAALRILVVNDDEDGLYLLERAIAREFPEATLVPCRSAPAALAAFAAQPVDAVVTDNRMPEMTGLALVQAIRRVDRRTPILMLTGSVEKRAEALEAGVTAFISSGDWAEIRRQIRLTIEAAPPR